MIPDSPERLLIAVEDITGYMISLHGYDKKEKRRKEKKKEKEKEKEKLVRKK